MDGLAPPSGCCGKALTLNAKSLTLPLPMLELHLNRHSRKTFRVLCVGAHCDDIEIGCGATLLVLQQQPGRLTIDWAVLSGSAARRREALQARRLLVKPAARGALLFGDFRDGRLPAQYAEVKDYIEALKKRLPAPDLVLCHERDDRHQDHRVVNEMVWNTFRDQLVLEYEIPKWDGGLSSPNVYVQITRQQGLSKVRALLRAYPSQARRDWFTADTFMALLRLRGIECRSPSGLAEAFHGRKIVI